MQRRILPRKIIFAFLLEAKKGWKTGKNPEFFHASRVYFTHWKDVENAGLRAVLGKKGGEAVERKWFAARSQNRDPQATSTSPRF
jgi:hypothetical protein